MILNRRNFIKTSTIAGIGVAANSTGWGGPGIPKGLRVGIIGLDTSHCLHFTKALNNPDNGSEFGGYKVVAAYPTKGSKDLPASIDRIAGFTEQVNQMGVEIVGSIDELLKKIDVVLLLTVDGRKHPEQALPILKAGKRMFIDKPFATSLADAVSIFVAANRYKTPIFSSSSLRYIEGAEEIVNGKIGKVLGADIYGPAYLEKTHPDLFWYGIHGIELLFAVMETGCKEVTRFHTDNTDLVIGTWSDNRIGTYRGTRYPKDHFGGIVFGETGTSSFGRKNYHSLLEKIVHFFNTGIAPVKPEETLEIIAFMEAADISRAKGEKAVNMQKLIQKEKLKHKIQ